MKREELLSPQQGEHTLKPNEVLVRQANDWGDPAIFALDQFYMRYPERLVGAVITGPGLARIPTVPQLEQFACQTTHCRAGWAVILAGEPGYLLEKEFSPALAGALIYAASYPGEPIPDFYAENDTARASIRRRANREAEAANAS